MVHIISPARGHATSTALVDQRAQQDFFDLGSIQSRHRLGNYFSTVDHLIALEGFVFVSLLEPVYIV